MWVLSLPNVKMTNGLDVNETTFVQSILVYDAEQHGVNLNTLIFDIYILLYRSREKKMS